MKFLCFCFLARQSLYRKKERCRWLLLCLFVPFYVYFMVNLIKKWLLITSPSLETQNVVTINPYNSTDSRAPQKHQSGASTASSISTKTLKDMARKVEGTYVGTGSLKQGSSVVEEYSDIKVVLTRKANNVVW